MATILPGAPKPPMINVGIVGLGFMGRTHLSAVTLAQRDGLNCRLAAVADADPNRLTGRPAATGNLSVTSSSDSALLFDPETVRTYRDAAQLFADPLVNLVSICTHTDTHVDLAIAALTAGKHVIVEKPVAIRSSEVRRLADASHASGRLCFPAMCMRFWPGWSWLKARIADGSLGSVRSAVFQRLGTAPDWTPFYADFSRSGGPLFDLHIHDTDFIRWCFGDPSEVVSTGTILHLSTLYRYPSGPAHVMAEGGLDHAKGFGFKMRFVVVFDHATADFDLTRSPRLLLCRDGKAEEVEIPVLNAYDLELRHMLATLNDRTGHAGLFATIDDAVKTTRLLEAERQSMETGLPVKIAH